MKSRKSFLLGAAIISALIFVAATVPRNALRFPLLQTDMDGNQQCITNLDCIKANTGTFNNLFVTNINGSPVNLTTFVGCKVDIMQVIDMATNLVLAGSPNQYWIDWGHTNSLGQTNIYASLLATSDVRLHLPTNGIRGSLMSFNIVASGGNRTIQIETNMPHFDTNGGFVLSGSLYSLVLSNGCEFRMTCQSNQTMSTLWRTFGQ